MAKNGSLNAANKAKEDEFYTKLTDIEKELKYYKKHFEGKTVFLNCDDPESSNFWKYFQLNFNILGIKKLISTHYEEKIPSYKLEMIANDKSRDKMSFSIPDIIQTPLKENGDFRSPECIEILKEADIIVTNPPFSLFREYVATLMKYNKKFLIIGSQNNVTYKDIFTLMQQNKIWIGNNNGDMEFVVPDYYEPRETRYREEGGIKYRSLGNICWFTNLDIDKRHEEILLYKTYNEAEYPKYDDYDAIEVSKVSDIPLDYDGIMGVPITFMMKYNPEQFEILGLDDHRVEWLGHGPKLNGKIKYRRIIIRRKN